MTKKLQSITNKTAPVLAIAVAVLIWYIVCDREVVPAYMLPSPASVVKAFCDNFSIMMKQAAVTLQESVYGLVIGIILAFIVATLMDRFSFLYKALYPLLDITQTIPTIAIAPLLVLWMGFGMAPKITLVVITTFFPITIGLLGGITGLIFSLIISVVINLFAMGAIGGGGLTAQTILQALIGGEEVSRISAISPGLMLFAIVFSVLVGLVSGYYPANKAVKIPALEAIKHE